VNSQWVFKKTANLKVNITTTNDATTLSITTLSIMPLAIKGLDETLSLSDIQHKNALPLC